MSHADSDAGRGDRPALGAVSHHPAARLRADDLLPDLHAQPDLGSARPPASSSASFCSLCAPCSSSALGLEDRRAARRRSASATSFDDTLFNRQRLALLAFTAAFVVTLAVDRHDASACSPLIASMRVLGVRDWRILVAVAFATAATVHFLLIYLLGQPASAGRVQGRVLRHR